MIGKTVSHYRIIEKIGEGGMGVVYRAEDLKLHREVALKFLPPDLTRDPEAKERFLREARAASSLEHSGICNIHQIDETDDGQLFICMACYDGETLKQRIERGPLPPEEAADLAAQVARGLAAAHERGVVHRDIKPANILITGEGQAKILDFGLAKLAGQTELTRPGVTLGTAAYMSPEQVGGRDVDRRTDIWSLGAILYEMITGRRPFEGGNAQAVMRAILDNEPEPPSGAEAGAAERLARIAAKALSKNPDDRYESADAFAADLVSTGDGRPSEAEARPTIAVLPFVNMSADPEQEYFCDGMAEEIINALAKLGNLRVVARTSAFAFRDEKLDVREVGRRLRVGTVLEGSVRKAGTRLRITTQLISVEDGYHIWSERYDREMEDVFAIQDDISASVVEKLKVKLLGHDRTAIAARRTRDPEAYGLYLKGRFHWNKRSPEGARRSLTYFRQAIERDPDYAPAYAGVADAYLILENLDLTPSSEAFREAREAVAKALELDDSLAEAHATLGWIKMVNEWDWEGGRQQFLRAIDLNPGYATAHQWYAVYFVAKRQWHEALAEMRRAQEIDPLSLVIGALVGEMLLGVGEYDEAIEQYNRTLEIEPGFLLAHFGLAEAYVEKGMRKEALEKIREASDLPGGEVWGPASLGHFYATTGRRDDAIAIVESLKEPPDGGTVPAWAVAAIYAALGENDVAFEWIEKLVEERSSRILQILVGRTFDDLQSDPRFGAFLKKIGLGE